MSCPFCDVAASRVFHDADPLIVCLWDTYPVSPGHALVVTRRHVDTWFEATRDEQASLLDGILIAKSAIEARHRPDGYNVGFNVGAAAGQTVVHLHVHVIPRYHGDVTDPTGGVRQVIADKANYLGVQERKLAYAPPETAADAPERIFGTEQRPLIDALRRDLARADRLDLAVAFVLESGLEPLLPHVEDLLDRGGKVRVLAGDYMGVTEPRALVRLLDLSDRPHGSIDQRLFETTAELGFHPKAYLLGGHGGEGVAYVGSSNLTRQALFRGLEWNYRLDAGHDAAALESVQIEFEALFRHPRSTPLTMAWIDAYRERRPAEAHAAPTGIDPARERPDQPPAPHEIQQEALQALAATRQAGNRAGLVVLATGLGKTWLAAFDAEPFRRVLFVAHREEILTQARSTFRRIRPDARLGRYTGDDKDAGADIVLASIQTLGRTRHLEHFSRDAFDYVIIDEFHHAAAATYRRLIRHFDPGFLLGLTATPDRTDGADLLTLCDENLVYRCDLMAGIERELLCPFHYHGVPDDVDYANIPWRSGRFDPADLETALVTERRAQNAYEQWRKRGGERTLAFCASKRHANYMSSFFAALGVRTVAVHSGAGSSPRADSLEKFGSGELQVVFAVDMLNEGVDVPAIDTVLMLRPTESRILWLQQFGRGLRTAEGKDRLTVVDYIGNHRTFLQVPMLLLPGVGRSQHALAMALERCESGQLALPPGCEVTYDLEALNILKALIPKTTHRLQALQSWYEGFSSQHATRPRAAEAWHVGHDPKGARRAHGSWLGFVRAQGDLAESERKALDAAREFLGALETTPMVKSYKMLTLLAMIEREQFPGEISIDDLANGVVRMATRSALLADELGDTIEDRQALRKLLETNPIHAWVKGQGMGGHTYFRYEGGVFSSTISIDAELAASFRELTEELCEWRLAQYLERLQGAGGLAPRIICNVSHTGGRPMLFLPSREHAPGIPRGPTPIEANGEPLVADFVKVAVNVVRREGQRENQLPALLRGWFGEKAGQPGRGERVVFELVDGTYRLAPLGGEATTPRLWHEYQRGAIPGLWGFAFSQALWHQGFVQQKGHIFLLVSLKKTGLQDSQQYDDAFLSPNLFQWHSQNRHKRASKIGDTMARHRALGVAVHLFARDERKTARGRGAPFVYCGELGFVDWEGDQPITVRWRLEQALPGHLRERFRVATS